MGAHLLEHLWELGPLVEGNPVTFQEIRAWDELTAANVRPWEASALRRLSCDYFGELQEAREPSREPPWKPAGYVPDRMVVAAAMREDMAAMLKL